MSNKEKRLFIFSSAVFQISLLMVMSFAVAFILESSLVSGQEKISHLNTFSRTNSGTITRQESFGFNLFKKDVTENYVFTQKYSPENGLQYFRNDELISFEEAKAFSDTSGIDISQSADFAFRNSLRTSELNLGSVTSGQNLGDGISAISSETINGKTTLTLQDAAGKTHTVTGSADQSIGNVVTNSLSSSQQYSYEVPLFGFKITNFLAGNLVQGLVWSIAVVGAIQLIGGIAGLDQDTTNTASIAAASGIIGGKFIYGLFGDASTGGGVVGSYIGPLGATVIGAAIAVTVFVLMYKKEKKKLVNFQCFPFEPPLGGAKCEDCNKDPFRPCSEYRCRSLGQACELVNQGTLEEACVWKNPKDVVSPTIQPWDAVLKPSDLDYTPDSTIRPPDRGVKIVTAGDECLQAFTPLEFGITIDEPAQCKIDYNHTNSFDDMQFYFGGSNYFRYNHTQKMKLPGPDDAVLGEGDLAPELENDGFFSLFVRCRDANGNENKGNENVDEFVFNFCVDPSPDTTPPKIEGTSILDGSPVRFGADEVPIEVYVNEPAQCRWSRQSKNYDDMENSMDCATETFQINANLNYVCSGNLIGIKDREDNEFFFRCKDQPNKPDNERNVMVQSYPLTLRGSQELNIIEVTPNGTIFGSTDTVSVDLTVRTDDGSDEGKAICYFSNTGETDSYIAMFETDSFEHKQSLDLVEGNYEYFFRCIDRGGNTAEDKTEFTVFVDKEPPMITRAYKEEGLKIVTNEEAECVYSLSSCNYEFSEGLKMIYSNPDLRQQHFAEWQENRVYYVKCRDLFGNQQGPNECGIVVKSVDLDVKK